MTRSRRSTIVSRGVFGAGVVALLACCAGIATNRANAADLDYRSVPQDRYGSAYEDPRYADLYAPAPPRAPVIQHHAYGYAPIPREPVYRNDEPRYVEPRHDEPRFHDPAPPRRYGYQPYPPAAPRYAERPGCTTPRAAQRALEQDGWRDFANLNLRGDTAFINARRPDGRAFELQLDRCTGDLVSARPLGHRPYGPNVYGERSDPRAF
jgi:hypothetical protein